MRFKNNVGPQVRRRRYALGWSQSDFAAKLQIAGFDISRSGVSKIEARLSYVDDKTLVYLAEVLKVQVQELFLPHTPGNRLYEFIEKLETSRLSLPSDIRSCSRYHGFAWASPKASACRRPLPRLQLRLISEGA